MVKRRTITATNPVITLAKSFNISLVLHMLPLLLLISIPSCIGCGGGSAGGDGGMQERKKEEKKKASHQGEEQQIKEKDPEVVEIKIVRVKIRKNEAELAYEAALRKQEKCKPFFGGIGITFDGFSGTVQKVYKYYPAWAAGILEGDMISNVKDIKGEVGTEVIVKYSRKGTKMESNIKRGRICLEDTKKADVDAP